MLNMEFPANLHRFSVQECLDVTPLPANDSNPSVQRYMSRQPAWKPGNDLPWGEVNREKTRPRKFGPSAFGGHVYAQAPLAAARVVEKEDESAPTKGKLAIHVSQDLSRINNLNALTKYQVYPRSLYEPWADGSPIHL